MRDRIACALNWVMEGVVAVLALGSVWPFGSALPFFQWILFAAIALLLVLWGTRALVEGRFLWKSCPVTTCLAALCALTMLQVVPLPKAWVTALSPRTTELRDQLLPSAEETGAERVAETTATLSLAPGATRLEVLRLVSVLALFAAVRNNIVDPGSFYRLGWLMALNGVLLALVGMGQLTSSPRNVVYWSFPTKGQVFGPFVCRNHAAYYLNLCLGLAAGLLLGTRYFLTSDRTSWRGMFRDGRVLWLICFIGIMLAGLLGTLSRGGLIGLGMGFVTCFGLLMFRFGKQTPWIGAALIVGLSAALIFWQGSDRVSQRWEKLGGENSKPEARIEVWARAFPLIKEFPLFGTGWGTFGHIEQTRRHPGDDPYVFNDHAHNDFLELWIEGGTIQLLLVIAIIALVIRAGIRAASQLGDTGLGRLALGALLAVVAVVFHSFVDFGMHIPAVAVLAAVVGGLLMNLADLPPPVRARAAAPLATPLTPPPSMALAGLEAAALFIVAWYLIGAGWSDQQAERYLWASTHAPLNRKITYLTEAVAFSPDRAELYKELVDVLVESYFERKKVRDWADAAALVGGASGCPYPGVLAFCDRSPIRISNKELAVANDLLVRACRNNPLFFDAQVRLERISAIEALRAFKGKRLERLTFLSPSDPEPWYLAGKEALRVPDKEAPPAPDKAKAFSSFRRSLLADKKYLADIVALIPEQMSTSELLREVLPAAPSLIMETAKLVAKQSGNSDDGMPFYKEALRVLDGKDRALSDAEWMDKARAQVGLEDDEAAQKSFEQALSQNTQNAYWRYEYCELLSRRGQFREAHKQLGIVLHQAPHYHAARLLLNKVLKEDLN